MSKSKPMAGVKRNTGALGVLFDVINTHCNRDGQHAESDIEAAVWQIFPVHVLGSLYEMKWSRKLGGPTALDRLTVAITQAKGLLAALRELPHEAIDALRSSGEDGALIWWLMEHLEDFMPQAEGAAGRLASVPPLPKPPGRPRDRRASSVALACLWVYERFTQTRVKVRVTGGKRHGPFVDFVDAVYQALGIDAKAGSMAEKAVRDALAESNKQKMRAR